ncbi:MAG: hypothetical protein U9N45_07420, partial [Gemmatimonadota bacterium]|nr:hypothetical protein [Gemmatimonadota bacterium]
MKAIFLAVISAVCLNLSPLVSAAAWAANEGNPAWSISALPPSVRLDPSSGMVIDDGSKIYDMEPLGNLLEKNWVYDGNRVSIHAARGEYVSFQLVMQNHTDKPLKDIIVKMEPFRRGESKIGINPELFLEWAVEVKTNSTGYEKSSLGPGWYPDALIPLELIQQDVSKLGRLHYPLELPDFRNRIDGQRFLLVWVDQYVPLERESAPAGEYSSEITVSVQGGLSKKLPVTLRVWDFAVPNENRLAGNLQHEGFLKNLDPQLELAVYQLFKRHRVVPSDPTYTPSISVSADSKVAIGWEAHDRRLEKYFTGEAFTDKHGYSYGPGYGEPI